MAPSQCGRISAEGRNILWEALLNELKRSLEAKCLNQALKIGEPSAVLCDRGIFDSRAYLGDERAWQSALHLWGAREAALAARYDHVFHLTPCPEATYSLDNNKARRESYQEAFALDRKLWDAWTPTHGSSRTLVGAPRGEDQTFLSKLGDLTGALEARLSVDTPEQLRQPRAHEWHLPPREIIALADTIAAAPDLSRIAPIAISTLRRIQRIDRMHPDHRAFPAEVLHRGMRRSAAALGRIGYESPSGVHSGARVRAREYDALLAR